SFLVLGRSAGRGEGKLHGQGFPSSLGCQPTHQRSVRLLILDGGPEATALLLLAAHGAAPRYDAVLIPDTGWYPATAQRALRRLRTLATGAAMGWEPVTTTPIADRTLNPPGPIPLPLFTLHPDGTRGRLPEGCARARAVALARRIRCLLGHPRPGPVPDGVVAECSLGIGLEGAHRMIIGPPFITFRRPLTGIGWTTPDCRALLLHHGIDPDTGSVCTACPHRSNRSWRHLAATDPEAFTEATAVDAALRHGPAGPAPRGMPPGTTFFLHPERVPLDQADLSAPDGPPATGCAPWACRDRKAPDEGNGGGDR
ncbi:MULTISPECIES: hypothetical protein, partial [unclassified Nocardiopsis]|uniref:hypothetical protein n=2 Tax=Nocardiopsidaceae TaxID=83676 RepID=UPI00387AA812